MQAYLTDPNNRTKLALGTAAALVLGGGLYYLYSRSKKSNPLRPLFDVSTQSLKHLVTDMQSQMEEGLKTGGKSSLKMLPSYVGKPTGKEQGNFFALDLGGTNFRVIQLELKGNRIFGATTKEQFTISSEAMNGDACALFDFIADCIKSFLEKNNISGEVFLGFTFSFPVNQSSVASGTLIEWTKGFTTTGVVGNDVVILLNTSFKRKNVSAKVVALVNDTVGTMVTRCYQDPLCELGLILGTGTNACYSEKLSNIPKFTEKTLLSEMIINMEWGGYGSEKYLPTTSIDDTLDLQSKNPGRYRFEKSISGMYLGEISRLALLELCKRKLLFNGVFPEGIKTAYSFHTSVMADIQSDKSSNFGESGKKLKELYQMNTSGEERQLIWDVCDMVSRRAARLSAAAIVAVVGKIDRLKGCNVAVDGGVFENYPGFQSIIEQTMKELEPSSRIQLYLSKDGSGIGAACIAASVLSQ